MNERKMARRINIIVAIAVVFLFSLIVTLTVQFAVLTHQKNLINDLNDRTAEYNQKVAEAKALGEHYTEEEFFDEYVMTHLNKGKEGAKKLEFI